VERLLKDSLDKLEEIHEGTAERLTKLEKDISTEVCLCSIAIPPPRLPVFPLVTRYSFAIFFVILCAFKILSHAVTSVLFVIPATASSA